MRYFNNILLSLALVCGFCSCADYVNVMPDNVATIDYAFRDRTGAEKFLSTCYYYIPQNGNPARDVAITGSDETWNFLDEKIKGSLGEWASWYVKQGLQNANSPYINYWDGLNQGGPGLFKGIRYCNIFIDNIDNVFIDVQPEDLSRMKAEVKVLKAYYHFFLMRMYGPIPLMKGNLGVDASPEDVRVFRDTWDDCINYVVQLIDEAVPYLPLMIDDIANEQGRITQPAALAIKALALVTSASPLFNGNPEYASVEDKRGVKLFPQTYDNTKWEAAAKACKEAIDASHEAGHELYTFSSVYTISDKTRLLNTLRCVYTDRFNSEMIWCAPKYADNNGYEFCSKPFLKQTDHSQCPGEPSIVPTFRIVEKFYTKNGVPMDEDKAFDYVGRYDVITTDNGEPDFYQSNYKTAKMNVGREPRFYANIAFDGGYWWGNGFYTGSGSVVNCRQGDISGKQGSLRYSITGYWMKKPTHYLTVQSGTSNSLTYVNHSVPIIRLSNLYLLYAEALNEAYGPTEECYEYLDKIRNHAGLEGVVESWEKYSTTPDKPKAKDGLREIIQRERDIELCFESQHFWDVRRWKKAVSEVTGPIYSWNIEASDPDEYYRLTTIANLKFTTKEYLWPIRTESLRVNTNLVQNPYWE